MAKNPNRKGLNIKLIAGAASSALQGYQKTKSSEDEKTRALKEKHRKQQEARRKK
tara:strand:+ start:96 stop:260 length:165 start_codon:yes stop_codon:yes gene_type:complete